MGGGGNGGRGDRDVMGRGDRDVMGEGVMGGGVIGM